MLIPLAGLADLRRHLGLAPTDTQDDPRLYGALIAASAQMARRCGRQFGPVIETRLHHARRPSAVLPLDGDLLELHALSGDGGQVPTSALVLEPAGAAASLVRRLDGARFSGMVQVTGVWGWHDDPARLWLASGDSVQNDPLPPASAALQVTNADGLDAEARGPRLQAGRLLRIEAEWLYVHRVESPTLLTVERALGGTNAAPHGKGAPIFVYRPPQALTDLALRWAAWLVQRADPPSAALDDALSPYRRPRVA